MPLRPLRLQRLLRLLLLAVFFNAAIGMPLHEAEHMRQDVESAAQAVALETIAEADSEAASPGLGDQEIHGACEWCLAHAHLAAPPARLPAALEVVQTTAMPRAPPGPAFVPFAGRWPFASRAPPNAST